MYMKLFALLALASCCTASLERARNLVINEDTAFMYTTTDGRSVHILKQMGNLGKNYLEITVDGPYFPAKTVRIYDELDVQDIYDDLVEIFAEYRGVNAEVVFTKFLHRVEQYVATGKVDPTVLEVLKYIITPVHRYGYPWARYTSGRNYYGNEYYPGQNYYGQDFHQYYNREGLRSSRYPWGVWNKMFGGRYADNYLYDDAEYTPYHYGQHSYGPYNKQFYQTENYYPAVEGEKYHHQYNTVRGYNPEENYYGPYNQHYYKTQGYYPVEGQTYYPQYYTQNYGFNKGYGAYAKGFPFYGYGQRDAYQY